MSAASGDGIPAAGKHAITQGLGALLKAHHHPHPFSTLQEDQPLKVRKTQAAPAKKEASSSKVQLGCQKMKVTNSRNQGVKQSLRHSSSVKDLPGDSDRVKVITVRPVTSTRVKSNDSKLGKPEQARGPLKGKKGPGSVERSLSKDKENFNFNSRNRAAGVASKAKPSLQAALPSAKPEPLNASKKVKAVKNSDRFKELNRQKPTGAGQRQPLLPSAKLATQKLKVKPSNTNSQMIQQKMIEQKDRAKKESKKLNCNRCD